MSDFPTRICTCGETSDDTNLRSAYLLGPQRPPIGRTHHFDTLPCHDRDCSKTSCPEYGAGEWAIKELGL